MRMMATVSVPTEAGNRAMQDGTVASLLQQLAERWKPEAMYFTNVEGRRGGIFVFDLPDPSGLPEFCEPLYQGLGADITCSPAMTMEDLQRAMSATG